MGDPAGFAGSLPRTSEPNAPPTDGAAPQKADDGAGDGVPISGAAAAPEPPAGRFPEVSGPPLSGASVNHAPLTPTRSAQDESSGSE